MAAELVQTSCYLDDQTSHHYNCPANPDLLLLLIRNVKSCALLQHFEVYFYSTHLVPPK